MSMATRLLLLRHGQTTAGEHVFLGSRSDPRLSREGQEQARRAVLGLSHVTMVVASPLRRAAETPRLAVLAQPIQFDDRFREIDYGLLSGLTVQEGEKRFPSEVAAWRTRSEALPGPKAWRRLPRVSSRRR
jgi:ribonuclease H / adenosylcobalamin/alpha-ribazole phosphatase